MAEGSGNSLTMQMLIFNIGLDIYSFFVLLMISQYLQKNRGDGQEQILFRQVIGYTALALIGDLGSWIVNGRAGVMMHFLGYAFNMVYMLAQLAAAVGAYRQLHYMCRNSLPGRDTERRWILAPCILIAVFTLSTPWTGLVFSLSPDNLYQRGILLPVFSLFTLAYVLAGSILALRQEKKEVLAERKQKYRILALYCLPPIAGSLIQTMIYGMSLVMPCSVFSLLLIFINEQHLKISADPLTGLNNRRRLDHYLEDLLPDASAAHPILLFIMDINDFKSINDLHGHLEGDHALRTFAAVLGDIAGHCDAFAARYGGDEFCLVMEASDRTPEQIKAQIEENLRAKQDTNCSYQLTASIGWTVCDHAESTPESALVRADQTLYEAKKQWHAAH